MFILFAVLCYAGVTALLYRAYEYKGVGLVNVLWSGVSVIMMLAIGYLVFKERLIMREWIGVAFIAIGLCIAGSAAASKR